MAEGQNKRELVHMYADLRLSVAKARSSFAEVVLDRCLYGQQLVYGSSINLKDQVMSDQLFKSAGHLLEAQKLCLEMSASMKELDLFVFLDRNINPVAKIGQDLICSERIDRQIWTEVHRFMLHKDYGGFTKLYRLVAERFSELETQTLLVQKAILNVLEAAPAERRALAEDGILKLDVLALQWIKMDLFFFGAQNILIGVRKLQ